MLELQTIEHSNYQTEEEEEEEEEEEQKNEAIFNIIYTTFLVSAAYLG